MHDIEPFFKWRAYYIASEDKESPFYQRKYNEFSYTNKIYNYFIHPQWDSIGSPTIYAKILFVDYNEKSAIIELIGEWNDLLNNEIMIIKRNVLDNLINLGITKIILLCDHVLNFHGDDDSYYEEWWDDIKEENGWVALVNVRDHIIEEMERVGMQYYINFGDSFNDIQWRLFRPQLLKENIEKIISNQVKQLDY